MISVRPKKAKQQAIFSRPERNSAPIAVLGYEAAAAHFAV
jgi:hypothetical protein